VKNVKIYTSFTEASPLQTIESKARKKGTETTLGEFNGGQMDPGFCPFSRGRLRERKEGGAYRPGAVPHQVRSNLQLCSSAPSASLAHLGTGGSQEAGLALRGTGGLFSANPQI
jgi:hypothetical protein